MFLHRVCQHHWMDEGYDSFPLFFWSFYAPPPFPPSSSTFSPYPIKYQTFPRDYFSRYHFLCMYLRICVYVPMHILLRNESDIFIWNGKSTIGTSLFDVHTLWLWYWEEFSTWQLLCKLYLFIRISCSERLTDKIWHISLPFLICPILQFSTFKKIFLYSKVRVEFNKADIKCSVC